ncbi:MAG: tRNA-specific adenosine deaminase [Rhodospirillaceae bacterium]|nr:tRNA-specific adenosine deaminase [Rhodospirillaceae bacterium]|tara:strand:- start:356 stop:787 length:432 start_codon:yes stop_codon:yes gene_type:complete
MSQALELACEAGDSGEVPVGAVLVSGNDLFLAGSGNKSIITNDPTAHAEICVLRAAGERIGNYRLPGSTLYVTLEPCPMCACALVQARIKRIIFGAADSKMGACGSVFNLTNSDHLNHRIEVRQGPLSKECGDLLKEFFGRRR